MIKYFLHINVVNENYYPPQKNSDLKNDPENVPYLIRFKCIGDSIMTCMDRFYEACKKTIKEKKITDQVVSDSARIIKIDTDICPQYEKIFLEKNF